jgi:hypothetical protein
MTPLTWVPIAAAAFKGVRASIGLDTSHPTQTSPCHRKPVETHNPPCHATNRADAAADLAQHLHGGIHGERVFADFTRTLLSRITGDGMNLRINARVFAIIIGLHLIAVLVLGLYDGHPREDVRSAGPYAMAPSTK